MKATGCPSTLPGSDHRVVGLCCLKQVGFQAGGNPTWCGLTYSSNIGPASKWGLSHLRVPSSCHEYGLNCLSEFQLPSRGDPTSGSWIFANFSRAGGCWFLTSPSKLGVGSGHRNVGVCCFKQVGFPAGGDPAWCGRTCFRDIYWDPSGGDPP